MADCLPFNSLIVDEKPDRAYKAEDWAWYFATFIGNGVFPKPSDGLQVNAFDRMEVRVNAGYAFINGYAFRNPRVEGITLGMAEGAQNRIDRIVVRWDLPKRDTYLAVLKGAPSAKPAAPALTRNTEIWELALADVYVGKGVTKIQAKDITDQRFNSSVCGIVKGTVEEIDASVLTKQFNDFFNTYSKEILEKYGLYLQDMESYISGLESAGDAELEGVKEYFAGLSGSGRQEFEDFKAEIAAYIADLQKQGNTGLAGILQGFLEFRAENETDFLEWFERIKGILEAAENGSLLEHIQYLLDVMYDTGTPKDVDRIIAGTYVDSDDDNGFFEAGTRQDVDAIIGGTFTAEDSVETTGQKIQEIVDRSFEETEGTEGEV